MSQRGHNRERAIRRLLEAHDWVTVRSAGSLGPVDVVALKRRLVLAIEVKSTAGGPYERFGPAERAEMLDIARRAGATPLLAYWPPRSQLKWIAADRWPGADLTEWKPYVGRLPTSAGGHNC